MCLKSMLRIYSKEEFIMAIFKIIKGVLESVYNTKIEWVRIPDGVTAIESNAFEDCKNLKSIVIPDSVKTIGRYAFKRCTSLKSIVIPDGEQPSKQELSIIVHLSKVLLFQMV